MNTNTLQKIASISKRILGKQGLPYSVSELLQDCFKLAKLCLELEKSLLHHQNPPTIIQDVPHLDIIPIPENRNRKFISTIRPRSLNDKNYLQKCG
jgi:hypothetical protein